jgi:5,10-methylene-tetrahydrofolate dehydrogenase/methenyl tetrahydrofolate cyclohydrolase
MSSSIRSTTQKSLLKRIDDLNADDSVHGLILQVREPNVFE